MPHKSIDFEDVASRAREIGFVLDEGQPHVSGERFLMQKDKLVLVGLDEKLGKRVIIKASALPAGREEIFKEKKIRDLVMSMDFSDGSLLTPEEVFYGDHGGYLFLATEFIPQKKVFAAYSVEDQFFMALRVFEEQELFHATTYEHLQSIRGVCEIFSADRYLSYLSEFKRRAESLDSHEGAATSLSSAYDLLYSKREMVGKFANYLTHSDLVPGNMRIYNGKVYLLDLSAIQFGNKYEGWARFLNWALLHSPELERILVRYVADNRGAEESECLRLMRSYKSALLVDYYIRSLRKTNGDLRSLTERRIAFWCRVLNSFVRDEPISPTEVEVYKSERDRLRSKEEVERQKEINIVVK